MIFVSKYKKYKIAIKASRFAHDAYGNKIFMPGLEAKFIEGRFETQDKELIDALLASPLIGIDFWAEEKLNQSEESKKLQEEEVNTAENLVTACPMCPYKATTLAGLKSHMRAKHPGSTE